MAKWGALTQKHREYKGEQWQKTDLLYRGGFDLCDSDLLDKILPKKLNESKTRWEERKKGASYLNYFGDALNFFGAQLNNKQLVVAPTAPDGEIKQEKPPSIEAFQEDVDGSGKSFQQLVHKAFIDALLYRCAVVAVDFPNPEEEPETLLEQEERELDRPSARVVNPREILNWRLDERRRFVWAVIHNETLEQEAFDAEAEIVNRFKVWALEEGGVTWRLFEHRRKERDPAPKKEDDVPEIGSGQTSFRRLPLARLELPRGLWLANHLFHPQVEHYERRTCLVAAQQKSLLAIPVLKRGPEMPAPRAAPPGQTQSNPNRGRDPVGTFNRQGWLELGRDDALEYAEPAGGAYSIVDQQLNDLVDAIYRVAQQMAHSIAATSTAMGRSGISKQEDRNATEIVLDAYGQLCMGFAVTIHDIIDEGLGRDVFWSASGLSEYRLSGDRQQAVDEASAAPMWRIPSNTFKKRHAERMAARLLGDALAPEDMEAIKKEIDEGVDALPTEAEMLEELRTMQHGEDGNSSKAPAGRPNGNPGGGRAGGAPPRRGPPARPQ